MSRVLIVGGTGLVGGMALTRALADARFARVVAPTRRPLSLRHPKLENPVVDFDALPASAAWWRVDAVVCGLGTTIRDAGSRSAFRRVDFDYVLAAATHARDAGARGFALTSALGADARSGNFYLRTKGEAEDALRTLGYPSLTLVRPSMIGGERERRRPMEHVAARLMLAVEPLIPRRYRVVGAERIAQCLLDAASAAEPGVRVVESERI